MHKKKGAKARPVGRIRERQRAPQANRPMVPLLNKAALSPTVATGSVRKGAAVCQMDHRPGKGSPASQATNRKARLNKGINQKNKS